MVDYSKWNSIELSDDDEDDCHPNIDLALWKRLKKEKREKEQQEAEAKRQSEENERAAGVERIKAIDARLQDSENPVKDDEAAALRAERETVQANVNRLAKLRQDEEDKKKKYPKWNVNNIITAEKFDKTMLNKEDRSRPAPGLAAAAASSSSAAAPAAGPATSSAPVAAAAPAAAAESTPPKASTSTPTPASTASPAKAAPAAATTAAATAAAPPAVAAEPLVVKGAAAAMIKPAAAASTSAKSAEVSEEDVDVWVQQMEVKAHKFAASKTYEEYYRVLQQYPEIMVPETQDYLLLHVSDYIKRGMFDQSKHYLRAACIVQYSMELGKNGVQLFFHRMRDDSGGYRKVFERETLEYWERIRAKLEEMRKEKEAKAAPAST